MQFIKRLLNKLLSKDKRDESWRVQAEAIWKTLDRVSKEQEEFAKEMGLLREAQAKTHQEIQELKESQAQTDRIIRKSQAKTDEQIKKTDEEIRNLRASLAETDKYIRNLGKTVGELTGGWGKFVVGMVEPSVFKWVKERLKLKLKEVSREKELYENGNVVGDIDLFIEGIKSDGNSILVIVEIKSSFESSDMRKFKKLLSKLYDYLPNHYKNIPAIVAIAALRFGNGVKTDALKSGFYLFEPEDSIMKVTEPKKPKILSYKERE